MHRANFTCICACKAPLNRALNSIGPFEVDILQSFYILQRFYRAVWYSSSLCSRFPSSSCSGKLGTQGGGRSNSLGELWCKACRYFKWHFWGNIACNNYLHFHCFLKICQHYSVCFPLFIDLIYELLCLVIQFLSTTGHSPSLWVLCILALLLLYIWCLGIDLVVCVYSWFVLLVAIEI